MTDSTQFEEFKQWHEKNPFIFHWSISGGVISVHSCFVEFPEQNTAQRFTRALRYRGLDVSVNYRRVSLRSKCSLEKFLDALKASKIDWEDFKDLVSYLFFDGTKHICDRKA